jgi:hypothetical protein
MGPVRCKGNYAVSVTVIMPVAFRERTGEKGISGIITKVS